MTSSRDENRLSSRVTSVWTKLLFYFRKQWLRVLVLASLAIAVRAPALTGERIWDDDYLVHENPFIKSPLLILEVFRHYLFPDSYSAHYRPIQNLSFMLDYFLWNNNTYGFHLTNVLLHAASAVLLYFLLRQVLASLCFRHLAVAVRLRAEKRLSWISLSAFWIATIWAVHPVHSAAIDYISGRADSLAFVFAAGGWLLFLRGRCSSSRSPRAFFYSLAALSGLAALLAREISCIWMALFLAHLFFVERNCSRRLKVATLGCALSLLLIYVGFRHLPVQRPPSPIDLRYSPAARAVLMARALGDYGRLMFFPSNLHMERTVGFDPGLYRSLFDWRSGIGAEYLSLLGLLVFGLLLFSCLRKGRGQPIRVFGAAWFLAAYLPTSNIVQLNATAAEHWLYLPSVGFLICLFGWFFELPKNYGRAVGFAASFAVVCLSVRSAIRSSDWSDGETFYRHTFEAGSRSARVALNLGEIYTNRHDYAKAEKIFRSVLQQNPDYPAAQNNLAAILYRVGKKEEAEKLFADVEKHAAESRKDYPRTWIGAMNLAEVRHNAGRDDSAVAILDRARQDYPSTWDLIVLEAEILRKSNHLDRALELVNNFERDNWWHYGAALALGRLHAQQGDELTAEQWFRHASRLDMHEVDSLYNLALMRVHENRLDDAVRIERRAIARQPDEPRQYILLSEILEKMGHVEEAQAARAHVSKMRALADDLVLTD